jgi:hypothetical protein
VPLGGRRGTVRSHRSGTCQSHRQVAQIRHVSIPPTGAHSTKSRHRLLRLRSRTAVMGMAFWQLAAHALRLICHERFAVATQSVHWFSARSPIDPVWSWNRPPARSKPIFVGYPPSYRRPLVEPPTPCPQARERSRRSPVQV